MPLIEFIGESIQDADNVAANPSRLLNVYRTPVFSEGRTRFVLNNVLGQTQTSTVGSQPIRAMGRGNQKSFVIGQSQLWEIDPSDGSITTKTAIDDDPETLIDGNYTDTTITCGDKYYVWTAGETLIEPTTLAFGTVGSHCYIGGYTVITEKGGRRFQWSDQGDAQNLQADHVAVADLSDDNILRAVRLNGDLLLMCEESIELWQLTGAGAAAFSRVPTETEVGLKAFNLMAKLPNALGYVGEDGRVYIFGMGPISREGGGVETSIAVNDPTHCFYYEDRGSKMFVIRFSDRPAWCYDMLTGEWHERAENASFERWRATHSIEDGDKWRVGNISGQLLELQPTSQDIDSLLYRRMVGRTVDWPDGKPSIDKLEIKGRMGDHSLDEVSNLVLALGDGTALKIYDPDTVLAIGGTTGEERDGILNMYESGDGGRTWSENFPRSMGRSGDYEQRMIWDQRGQFTQYTVMLEVSEPADIKIYADCEMEISLT